MIQIKKTILTLVALLAVTTGAWATTVTWVKTDFFGTGSAAFTKYDVTVTPSNNDARHADYFYNRGENTFTTTLGNFTKIEIVFMPESSPVNISGWYYELIEAVQPDPDEDPDLWEYTSKLTWTGDAESVSIQGLVEYIQSITFTIAEPASGPEVAWDKAKNSGSFTMPGGNVTLEPEYYPQAALAAAPSAINDVPATTDGAIVEAGTVANIGETANAQGTVMYYVSPTALDDAALLALAADKWTADVPTAADLAQGQAYVYYYVRGNDSDNDDEIFSDGDILAANALTVNIAAAPLWNAEFDLTDAPEEDKAGKWSTDIPEGGVVKGQTVTVTYTGSKKVIGVKAEKKAAAPAKPLANATAEDLGKIAGADGNIYDTKAAAEAANTTAVAMIAYVGSASDCTHGLAIALADESGTKTWSEAGAACSGKTAVTGGTWRLPSIKDWQYMFIGCGASGSYSDSPSTMSYSELATKLTTANGTALQTASYWSSTESYPGEDAWSLYFEGSSASFFSGDYEGGAYPIRACLAF